MLTAYPGRFLLAAKTAVKAVSHLQLSHVRSEQVKATVCAALKVALQLYRCMQKMKRSHIAATLILMSLSFSPSLPSYLFSSLQPVIKKVAVAAKVEPKKKVKKVSDPTKFRHSTFKGNNLNQSV